MADVRETKVHVPELRLQALKKKLALTDLPDQLENETPWERGVPLGDVSRILNYWKDGFSWRNAEGRINQHPQKMVQVDIEGFGSQSVHVFHWESSAPEAIPLLFIHGWPGSAIEATKVASILVQSGTGHPSFHVVAPDLVNFGFSSSCSKVGFAADQHAETCHKVMRALGYTQYAVQGGDVGYAVARTIVHMYPESCKAHHLNMVAAREPDPNTQPDVYEQAKQYKPGPEEAARLARFEKFLQDGMGYAVMHSTRPQTLAYSLADSPVGLLAWIYEKLRDWSDSYPWTDDEILTWVCIYYFSTAGPWASQRWYFESSHSTPAAYEKAGRYCEVPLGISRFPEEYVATPRPWSNGLGPVVFERDHERGGHFAAWECPDLLAQDLRDMFGEHGGAYSCIRH